MKTIRVVEIITVFCEEDLPLWTTYEEGNVYYSEKHSRIGFKCLCGCGALTIIPVNQSPQGWQLEIDEQKRLTLIGSVLQSCCKAHYIITKNKANFV
jgi:hypothetical protein